jgi:hypothetical protein
MRSGMFRRRKAAVVTVLVAGSAALGSGLPVLMSQNANYSAEAAVATITLSVNSIPGVTGPVNVTFAKLGGITYDVGAPQPSPTCTHCKTPVTVIPPTVTLRVPYAANITTYQDMLAWERAMRAGLATGRENATLTLASSTGTTIATYTLENGYPTNVDVAAGDPQSVSFSVTLTGDELILASPGG